MIRLPEGAATEERLRRIEDRLTALESRCKPETLADSDVTVTSPERDEPASSGNHEKEALVEKLIALKESNPKAVKAPPSAIPTMSVEKLTALITEAEAFIASGGQE